MRNLFTGGTPRMRRRRLSGPKLLILTVLAVIMCPICAYAAEEAAETGPALYATFWALVPPIVAIVLALITKEVYSSLLIGIIVGGLLVSNGNPVGMVETVFSGGLLTVLADSYNVGIIIFLVILGTTVALMNKTGGSAAFGRWASKRIKTRIGAQVMTIVLGCLIFIDDYFNCLTVGSVMRPITDKHQVSRAKLAYLIDATAAPVCIIAPVSSWAAAVTGFVKDYDGFTLFVKAIPFNFYAILTIVMMLCIVFMRFDFGSMRQHEINAINGDLFTSGKEEFDAKEEEVNEKGRLIDMLFPIILLIFCCIIGMIYTGGFFSGAGLITAFSDCDASLGLAMGSGVALVIIVIFYLCRRVLSFSECMGCLPQGFKAMVPAILILTFAWSLKAITETMGAAEFVAGAMDHVAGGLQILLPAIIFLVALGLAFATGTSWGTFGILIPIVVAVYQNTDPQMMIISISACMAGAVCGDHCSPISDTTIMASAGAQSNHINHVSTQLPYALTCAAISCVCYIIAALVKRAVIALPIAIVIMIVVMLILRGRAGGKEEF